MYMGKKILVVAYAVSPSRGSEYSVAWNYINEMSKDNELVVLYGASGDHMGDIDEMENWLSSNPIPNVRFVPVLPSGLTTKLNFLNRKGIFPYSFYLAFNFWQKQVYDTAIKIVENESFDLIHNLNPIGYREPGYLWKLDLPYIWGPIGGIPNRPKQLFDDLIVKDKLIFTVRNWINSIQFRFNSRLKKALNETDLLLTATSENKFLVENEYKIPSINIPENGIVESDFYSHPRIINLKEGDVFNIIWIGSIDARKSLNFLIEALGEIKNENWHLHILGKGSLKYKLQEYAKNIHIDSKVTWYSHIKREEVFQVLQSAHLHVITSLGEATTTVLFEAMTNGIPTISLDHCGMKDVICDKCGVRIDIQSVSQVKKDLALAISDLVRNPAKINNLSEGLLECSKLYSWDRRRFLFNNYYDVAIKNWKKNKEANGAK